MGEFVKRGLSTRLATYVLSLPTGTLTIGQLEEKFPEWQRAQILQAMSNHLNPSSRGGDPFNGRVVRTHQGIWQVLAEAPTQDGRNLITVEVLRERELFLVVEDVNDGKIYKMYLVG